MKAVILAVGLFLPISFYSVAPAQLIKLNRTSRRYPRNLLSLGRPARKGKSIRVHGMREVQCRGLKVLPQRTADRASEMVAIWQHRRRYHPEYPL